MKEKIELSVIGTVSSCFKQKFGVPRQSLITNADAIITLAPQVQPEISLQGLDEFSYVWIIYHFHKNSNERFHAKVHPPRMGGESQGLFATRSPHRPNPIGLSLVKLEKIEGNEVFVSGVDFIEGTPILDIKPYLPEVESRPFAKSGWLKSVNLPDVKVEFAEAAKQELEAVIGGAGADKTRELISSLVALDPRPNLYKGSEGKESKYREDHVFRLHDLDITFRFESADLAQVIKIQKINNELHNPELS